VGRTPAANRYELDFAKALISGRKARPERGDRPIGRGFALGQRSFKGHQFGPNSDSEEQMILSLDRDLDDFRLLARPDRGPEERLDGAFTADHGIAPIPGEGAKLGIHAAAVDMNKVYLKVNAELNKHHPAEKTLQYLMPGPRFAVCGFGQEGI
jgi:hypothetical protein